MDVLGFGPLIKAWNVLAVPLAEIKRWVKKKDISSRRSDGPQEFHCIAADNLSSKELPMEGVVSVQEALLIVDTQSSPVTLLDLIS